MPFHELHKTVIFNMKKTLFLIFFLISSCTNNRYKDHIANKKPRVIKNKNYCLTKLRRSGKAIKVFYKKKDLKACQFLKNIETDFCESTKRRIHKGARNHLRNQAAKLGATAIWIPLPLKVNKYQRIQAKAFGCL